MNPERSSAISGDTGAPLPLRAALSHGGVEPSPPHGVRLGVQLAAILALVVAGALGVSTVLPLRREIANERAEREALLDQSLVPLAVEIQGMPTLDLAPEALLEWRRAYVAHGEIDQHAAILLSDGEVLATTAPLPSRADDVLSAQRTIGLEKGTDLRLLAWRSDAELTAELSRRLQLWLVDLLSTFIVVLVVVEIAVHLLVVRPMGRLVAGLSRLDRKSTRLNSSHYS